MYKCVQVGLAYTLNCRQAISFCQFVYFNSVKFVIPAVLHLVDVPRGSGSLIDRNK